MVKKRHLLSIDIIRFIAALGVTLYHLGYKGFSASDGELSRLLALQKVSYNGISSTAFGWVGVQVFFVISGFVIAYSAEGEDIWHYTRRRFLRLVPVVWILAPLCFVISIFIFHIPLEESAVHLLRTAAFFPTAPWSMGQFWTLPIEVVFYICIGVLIRGHHTDWIERLGWGLAFVSSVYWLGDVLFHFGSSGQRLRQLLLLQHGVFFAVGITIYRASVAGLTPSRLFFLLYCCIPCFVQIRWASQWEATGMDASLRLWGAYGIWLTLTGWLFISTLTPPNYVGQPTAKFIRLLGQATYPLYLLHYHFGGYVLVTALSTGFSQYTSVGIATSLSVILSILIARYLEPLVREWISRAFVSMTELKQLPPHDGK